MSIPSAQAPCKVCGAAAEVACDMQLHFEASKNYPEMPVIVKRIQSGSTDILQDMTKDVARALKALREHGFTVDPQYLELIEVVPGAQVPALIEARLASLEKKT